MNIRDNLRQRITDHLTLSEVALRFDVSEDDIRRWHRLEILCDPIPGVVPKWDSRNLDYWVSHGGPEIVEQIADARKFISENQGTQSAAWAVFFAPNNLPEGKPQ